jgi:hypothetical protein
MKKVSYLMLLTLPFFTLLFCTSSSSVKDKEGMNDLKSNNPRLGSKNVAVLELFTSQGCSSCPPADRLLGTYASNKNTIVLSFHVDYWDRLGWKDPFSSKEYTRRQYEYASALHADVYTPQLVINGQTEMVGSDANKIANTIKKIFSEQPDAALSIKNVKTENGKADISFDASGNIANSLLNVALVEKKTTTNVKAGENRGVTLTNYNVIRNFETINKIDDGNNIASINIPSSADLKNISVVLFLQQKKSNKISAADQAGL